MQVSQRLVAHLASVCMRLQVFGVLEDMGDAMGKLVGHSSYIFECKASHQKRMTQQMVGADCETQGSEYCWPNCRACPCGQHVDCVIHLRACDNLAIVLSV